jgi:choline dehydrogenase-like flavoprotein
MTPRVVVVGSGASGVHFALTLLRKGLAVTMLDVGRRARPPVAPELTLTGLKDGLEDPAAYFLGPRYEGVLLPDDGGEYYGIPPSKDHVFASIPGFRHASHGFAPLFSFARGGLAEAWTGGCYPLNDAELAAFPFTMADLLPHYGEVARRIGVTGEADDLARFMPVHEHLLPPLRLDRHSERLLESYGRVRDRLNRQGTFVGRTRVATLSQPLGGRQPCDYRGRCLWGCPRGALYTPSQTLAECGAYPDFEYIDGLEVEAFRVGPGGRVRAVVARAIDGGAAREISVDRLALAAGALLSTKIVLTSVMREAGERIRLTGLMDNRQILVPFVNLGLIGQPYSPDTYQYHLLGLGLESAAAADYVHGQITTLKTALLHPIVQKLPFDLRASSLVVRALHAALGVVNVNFRDTRRAENFVELAGDAREPALTIQYAPDADEPRRIEEAMRRVRAALRRLNCVVPPGLSHVRPMGASVHYAGMLPMTRTAAPWTTTEHGQSREFPNLYLVDGATFPALPSKNLTFTLMANAVRVASEAF